MCALRRDTPCAYQYIFIVTYGYPDCNPFMEKYQISATIFMIFDPKKGLSRPDVLDKKGLNFPFPSDIIPTQIKIRRIRISVIQRLPKP